ncbi:MAG TPA: ferric reductase-like transmembrane domain-containing protein [Actinocrinis sp.]|uniref:ferric reductase-like transmembrane domain-containing protein n=1 Tax=Actinocrinis sp. TaxID=1920516 RepID=UPI002D59B124|nr:ferric reductase-like transmembrane domain-containing protein [Actinocrinis sp.]HZU55133.1 ferric reductase-like transmembrane domain-containing protein [Actinocrinis sp.]
MTSASTVITSTTPLWYATRATGVVALVLLTMSLVLGILITVRFATERWPRFVTIGIHRNLSLLVLAFLTVHIGTALLDSYAPVGWPSLVIPFVSAYRPLWLGLGTVAFDLLLALTITSLLRSRVGHRAWRAVHWAAYACWPLAVVHGFGTGTDPKAPAILGLTVVCVAAVVVAAAWRLVSGWPVHRGLRLTAGAASAVALIAATAWTASGPLKSDWAARAGTPPALLARANGAATANGAAGPVTALPALPLTTTITGSINTATTASGQSSVTIAGTGSSAVAFQVVITGPALPGGGVQMSSSRVTFGPSGQPGRYSGAVTGLNGSDITASVTDQTGAAIRLTLNLTINGQSVTGTLNAAARSGSDE